MGFVNCFLPEALIAITLLLKRDLPQNLIICTNTMFLVSILFSTLSHWIELHNAVKGDWCAFFKYFTWLEMSNDLMLSSDLRTRLNNQELEFKLIATL